MQGIEENEDERRKRSKMQENVRRGWSVSD